MDGLKKSKSPPFTLLATNFPSDLDSAVLRRVPSLIHLGLPSLKARQQIFQIYLAEEKLHPDVNLCHLAQMSQGYSGSDIQTVCVQAALICDTFIGDDARRYIANTHFDKAFQRSAPTVSKGDLAKIKTFSKEYNPAALESIDQLDKVGCLPQITSQPQYEEGKTTLGGDELPPKHTKMPPIGRVDGIDDHASATRLDELESPYPYYSLQPDSMQIRVLSILPNENNPDGLLRCTLRTVDLNDWTTEYRKVSSFIDAHGYPNLPRLHLAMWFYACSFVQGDRLIYNLVSKYSKEERLEKLWTNFVQSVSSLEGNHEIRHRFNWGDYTALSYVWGDATDRQDILLDGHRFSVARSLYNALSHLRDALEVEKRELHIWADAICINQDDQEERAREVKKMGLIYSQCFSDTAWLGDLTPAIACEVPSVRIFLNSMKVADLQVTDLYESGFELVMDLITRLSAAHSLDVVSAGLLLSPFWERLWTIQEVKLGPRILFHCGKEVFTTQDIWKLCVVRMRLLRLSNKEESVSNNILLKGIGRALTRLSCLRPFDDNECFRSLKLSTADYVRFAGDSKSKDPRDKVFGLVALLPDSIAERIKPNYDPSFTKQDTYVMFFKSCYQVAGNLDFLARVIVRPSFIPDLPSWALDLDSNICKTDSASGWILECNSHKHMTLAGQDHVPYRFHKTNLGMPEKQLTFGENDRLLFCEGVIVDALVSLGAVEISNSGLNVHLQAERDVSKSRAAIPASNYAWKLALVRVFMQDSFYEFSESPSVLDLQWPNSATRGNFQDWPDYQTHDYDRQLTKHLTASYLTLFSWPFLKGNEDFDIGGELLRDYFTSSTDTDRADPAEDKKLVEIRNKDCLVAFYIEQKRAWARVLREPALLFIHPGIGEILVFLGLVQYFPDRPIYGLRARGFNPGESPSDVLTNILTTYFEAHKKQQPNSPYATAGYSYDSMLAFELSKMLEAGGDVAQSEQRSEELVDELRELPQSEQVIKLLAESNRERCADLALTRESLETWIGVAWSLQKIGWEYEPSGSVECMDVFYCQPLKVVARTRKEYRETKLNRWTDFVRSEVRFHEVDGEHYSMIGPEHVFTFQQTLRKALVARGL
ncbi:MAG: hypothetical protein Q9180_004109 [Flavoplaca navasiana]